MNLDNGREKAGDEETIVETDLPGLRTWPRVYLFVGVIFVIWVILLTALSRTFS